MIRKLLPRLIFIGSLVAPATVGRADMEAVRKDLSAIDARRDGHQTRAAELEKECLALLPRCESDAQRGQVYLEIAMIYSQNGLSDPEKTIQTCRKALEHPLDLEQSCQMYVHLADGIEVRDARAKVEPPRPAELIDACMKGIAFIERSGPVPEKESPLPGVDRFDVSGPQDSPAARALQARHAQQMADRERVKRGNILLRFRSMLVEKLAMLSAQNLAAAVDIGAAAKREFPTASAAESINSRIVARASELQATLKPGGQNGTSSTSAEPTKS